MPTEKRARQKEGRRVRLEAQRKVDKRRQTLRRSVIVVIVAAVVVVTVYAFYPRAAPPTRLQQEQATVNSRAVSAGCPEQPATKAHPANTLHWSKPPPMKLVKGVKYFAEIETTEGPIEVALNAKHAPVNVNSFIFLAKKGFYHCSPFWRVVRNFMNQGGDQNGDGSGSPGYIVPVNEFPPPAPHGKPQYPNGTVAMANSCPPSAQPAQCQPSNTSQFFIMAGQSVQLPPKYTVIGHVIAGMTVVEKINRFANPHQNSVGTTPPLVINRITGVGITEH